MNHDEMVDASGMQCPLPLLKAKQALNKMKTGQVVYVKATDPGSVRDFEVFVRQAGHTMLNQIAEQGCYEYWIEKKG